MKHKGQQQHMLAVKNGSLLNPENGTINGLVDLIKLKSPPKIVNYFGFLVCIDQSGNPFIFYHDKNRYINIPTVSPATLVSYIDNKGGQLAIALQNKQILIVSCMNGRNLKTLKAHEHHILNLHTNHTQNMLLAVSQDQCVIYSLNTFDKIHSLFAKGSIFVAACFLSSSTELATIMADKSLSIWNLSSFEILSRIQLPEQQNIKQCQALPSLDGHRLIINCFSNKIHILDNQQNLITQDITTGYGNGIIQIKSLKKQQLLMLTKNHMIIQIDSVGSLIKCIEILQGKTATYFDVHNDKIAIVLNTGEIAIYDLKKLAKTNLDSTIGVNMSCTVKENYPDTLNFNNSTNIEVKKVGSSNSSVISNTQQTIKRNNNKSLSLTQPYNQHTIGKSFKGENPLKELLNYQKLSGFLKSYNLFPDDKRNLAWRSLLSLPMNHEAYNNLIKQGIHPAYVKLADQYPLQSESLFSRLQRTLSCLAYYCPLFAELTYLPQLVFPFVKLFKRGEELLIFEVTLSIIMQFCQRFFEGFPNAPVSLLLFHDQVLNQVDQELYLHLSQILGYQAVKYAWPSIKSLYTNLLSRQQWMELIDNFVLNNDQPQLIALVMVEYFRYFRNTILKMNDPDQLDMFFARNNPVEIQKILERAIILSKSLDYDQFQINFQYLLPLQQDQYQLFSIYPKGSVLYQARVREQLQDDEMRVLQKQQQIIRIQEMAQQMEKLDELFQQKQLLTVQAERDRQEMFDYQVEMRAQKQFQQDQQLRQQRIKQLENLEQMMNYAVEKQLNLQQKEQDYLNQQFRKTQLADNFRVVSFQEEEALQNLEFQIFQKFTQQMEQRTKQENQRKIQNEIEFRQKQKELTDQIKAEQWKTDSQQQQIQVEQLKQLRLAQMQELENDAQHEEAEYQSMINQFQQDLKFIQLEREKRLRDQLFKDQLQKEENQIRDQKKVEENKRQSSLQRRQQFEQEMERISKQHQDKLRIQEQQLVDQFKKSNSFNNYNQNQYSNSYQNMDQSSGDVREPMTSQKLSSAVYDFPSSQKQQQSPSMLIEDEREKFTQFRNQLRDEISNVKQREHEEQLQKLLKDREDEIFKKTQQISQQIKQQINDDQNNKYLSDNSAYNTGQFNKQQQYYSPDSSSQFSLYKPQQDVNLEPRDLSESQLTYSSGFTSPDQRF